MAYTSGRFCSQRTTLLGTYFFRILRSVSASLARRPVVPESCLCFSAKAIGDSPARLAEAVKAPLCFIAPEIQCFFAIGYHHVVVNKIPRIEGSDDGLTYGFHPPRPILVGFTIAFTFGVHAWTSLYGRTCPDRRCEIPWLPTEEFRPSWQTPASELPQP